MSNWHKDARGNPVRISLPLGETDSRKTYSFPNPEYRPESTWAGRYRICALLDDEELVSDLHQLLAMAEAYQDLTMNILGQEHSVKRLRDIWRARRAMCEPEKQEGEG